MLDDDGVVIIHICYDCRFFTRYSIQNYVDIHSKSDNTDENIMNIMMLMLNHVCGTIMILLIIIRLILFIAKTISKGDF